MSLKGKSNCRWTGSILSRGEKLQDGEYHLVVHIWIINSKSQYLIQKRASHLGWLPNIWAPTGGAVLSGEESLQAAIREVKEELGLTIDPKNIKCIKRFSRDNSLTDIWLVESDFSLDKINFNPNEVAKTDWITQEKIQLMVEEKKFFNYGQDYFNTIFGKAGK